MTRPRAAGQISAELEEALKDELAEVRKRYADGDKIPKNRKVGDFVYPASTRMSVIERCLKLEALKQKNPDASFGSEFGKDAS